MSTDECKYGYTQHDGSRYCHEHCGFLHAGERGQRCDRADEPRYTSPNDCGGCETCDQMYGGR